MEATETKREMKIKRGTKKKNLRQQVLVCVGSQCPASLWENYRRGRERESVCVCVCVCVWMSVHWRVWVCAMMCICECWCAFVYMHRFVRVCVRECACVCVRECACACVSVCAWACVSVCNKKNKLCRLNRLKSCCCFHSYFLATSEKFKTSSQFFFRKKFFQFKKFFETITSFFINKTTENLTELFCIS